MSYPSASIALVNSDKQAYQITVKNPQNMSGTDRWGGTLQPFSAMPNGYATVTPTSSPSAFMLIIIRGSAKTIITIAYNSSGFSATYTGGVKVNIVVDNSNVNPGTTFITIAIPNSSPATWMADMNNATGGKFYGMQLSRISMPGSHDAGMSVLLQHTGFSTPCNTQTQTLDIGEQLNAGVRYFDVRPSAWASGEELHAGHFDDAPVVGTEGGLGQDLKTILQQIAGFLQTNTGEIVIMNLSHFFMYDGSGFDYGNLVNNYIKPIVGQYMFTDNDPNIPSMTLSDIMAKGRLIVLAPWGIPCVDNQTIFSTGYDTVNKAYNLLLWDQYGNTASLSTMLQSQVTQYNDFVNKFNHSDQDMFLLSYTLTWGLTAPCIDIMAIGARPYLLMYMMYNNMHANIVEVDYTGTGNELTAAIYMSYLFSIGG